MPIVSQQRQAIAEATTTAQGLTTAATKEAATVDVHSFRSVNGQLNLPAIEKARPPLQSLGAQVTSAHKTLAGLHSGWLVRPIASRLQTFDKQLTKAGTNVSLGSQVIGDVPGLLGGNGARHDFVAS